VGLVRTLLSYAFRPFFLLNGLFAVALMVLWAFALQGAGPLFLPANIVQWHAHEMVVGFGMAAVAGFVLTAVATWTSRPPVRGAMLGLLVLSWLIGRLAMLFGGILPATVVLVADMLFPAGLFLLLAREVIAAGNKRNTPIIVITLIMAGLNGIYHLALTGILPMFIQAERVALYLLVHLLLLLITVIGGRIIPTFTANWLRARNAQRLPTSRPFVERATIGLTLCTGLYASVLPVSPITGALALATAVAHALRLSHWRGFATTTEPLLFILHVAYAWLPIGYFMTGMAALGLWIPPSSALHALTVGAIAMMILAVSTRVSLAHTGRPLHASFPTILCYLLLTLAALLRVAGPLGGSYLSWLNAAMLAWVLAFVGFTVIYAPMLLQRRADE